MDWVLIGIRRRRHRLVLERLEGFGVEVYAPQGRTERVVKYQREPLILATFPLGSYAFADLGVVEVRERIDDLHCFFYHDGRPRLVSDGEVTALREAQDRGDYDRLTPKARDVFPVGTKVSVVRGALRGLQGVVLRVSRRGRTATIEISKRPVDVGVDFIAPVT